MLASVIAFSCLFPSVAAADTNWEFIGQIRDYKKDNNIDINKSVADKLNYAGVGVGASVELSSSLKDLIIFGNSSSITKPGYTWKYLNTLQPSKFSNPVDIYKRIAIIANEQGAASATVTIDSDANWIIWGYTN
ncbi:hypothetical protein [Okeania sp. KiyG1]|uniref:hypothetical protein n=1 Tax=Okeania sp. KiyG1 TaxID=2720165 RepID=UPI0019204F89|nr:hypothetical protein [Okeania sp. KiyG1]GGA24108.1 hypothetical protein CYANOKiyG1_39600 [Okeania sp. KiyG1]